MPAVKICPVCGTEFTSMKHKEQQCCSRKCSGLLRRNETAKRNTRICPVCEKEFVPNVSSQVTCSRACDAHTRKQIRLKTCAFCGKEFQFASGKEHQQYCSKSCAISANNKARGRNMTGKMTSEGFVGTNVQGYTTIRINGVRKTMHRHIMEQHLGRPLGSHEHIHHKNGDRSDNKLENLEVWSTLIRQQPPGIHAADYILNLFSTLNDEEKDRVRQSLL